jgi:GNAT superfamily N-acetyltransferase
MPDMLVKLYEVPEKHILINELKQNGITIRRCLAMEHTYVCNWVEKTFGKGWVTQCRAAFENRPVSCHIAVIEDEIVGFACYDATFINSFGPTGVDEKHRGKNIGKALLFDCMHAMEALGYRYAIIGDAGPMDFYKKAVGALEIEGAVPAVGKGIFR